MSAPVVIPRLHKIFAEFGVPPQVLTDNGPPFNGKEFKSFAKSSEFDHRNVTPKWPQGNGEVEQFMRTIKKTIEAGYCGAPPLETRVTRYAPYLQSNATFFNRQAASHSAIQQTNEYQSSPFAQSFRRPASIKRRDQLAKAKMETYADRRVHVKPSNIANGAMVLVQRNPSHSSSGTPYNPKPFVVTNHKGTMVTAESEGKKVTRNSSFCVPLK